MTIPGLGSGYWTVASYGYPSPFGGARAREAWARFESFCAAGSYRLLKDELFDSLGLSSHATESWKSAFEKLGLLYVLPGSDVIVLTPAGVQLLKAGRAGDEVAFAWVGLNVLFRIPVGGWRRTDGGGVASNVLGYRFVHAAILDLDDQLWFEELQILTHMASATQAPLAVQAIRELRADPSRVEPKLETGNRYNLTRQVAVHASLNYLVLAEGAMTNPYGRATKALILTSKWRETVQLALSIHASTDACSSGGSFVPRVPTAVASFADEVEYFEYVGASVPPRSAVEVMAPVTTVMGGETVRILTIGQSIVRTTAQTVSGPIAELCSLARGDRVILTDDEQNTYKVEDKELIDPTHVKVTIRSAKPIIDYGVVIELLGGSQK
ncbi:MAG: hypothetical protein ACKVOG_07690 [Rhodoglobus sp.]